MSKKKTDKEAYKKLIDDAKAGKVSLNSKRKRSPQYEEMIAQHMEKLDEINQDGHDAPWDGYLGLNYFIEYLRFMRDYYALGENVWGADGKPSRLETIEQTLEYYDRWRNVEKRYIEVIECPEKYHEEHNDDGTATITHMGIEYKYKYSMRKTLRIIRREYKKYKNLFFKNIAKYIDEWWD